MSGMAHARSVAESDYSLVVARCIQARALLRGTKLLMMDEATGGSKYVDQLQCEHVCVQHLSIVIQINWSSSKFERAKLTGCSPSLTGQCITGCSRSTSSARCN